MKESGTELFISKLTYAIGTPLSIVLHTIFFICCFLVAVFGVPLNTVLLVLTTVVSLEAIYLSLFIQMSINNHSKKIRAIHQKVDELHRRSRA